MSSKINSVALSAVSTVSAIKTVSSSSSSASGNTSSGSTTSRTPTQAVDRVSLTSDAVRLQQLDRATSLNSSADVDVKRVAAVRAAIQNGTYKIDPQAIASKMLSFESALAGK